MYLKFILSVSPEYVVHSLTAENAYTNILITFNEHKKYISKLFGASTHALEIKPNLYFFRKAPHGPVYVSPVLLSPTLFLTSALNWGVVLGWSLLFDREYLWLSFVFLLLTCLSTYICLGLSYRDMAAHRPTLVKEGRMVDVWLVRVLVQNGLAMYATWCTFATLLNLAAAIAYERDFGISPRTSSTISLGILAGELVLFAISDWTFLDKYSRYTVSPYLVLIVALTGSVVQNWQSGAANSIFTVVLLVVSVIAFLVKIGLTILRHIRETDRRNEAVTTLDDNFTFRF